MKIGILFAFILILVLFIYLSYWSIHVNMNKEEKLPYDFVTFKTFLNEFKKYKDDPDLEKYKYNEKSIFLMKDEKYLVYLHANIVKFNDKCMIFYPIDYIKYCLWMKKFNKKPKENYRVN